MFSANTYQERRAALKKLVGNGILLIPGNSEAGMNYKANAYPFWQDKNFLYYFGLQQADLAGVIDADNDLDILFGDELSLDDQVWTGVLPTLHSRAAQAGIANIMPSKKLGPMLRAAKKAGRQIHLLPPYRGDHTLQWSEWLGVPVKRLGDFISEDLIKAVVHQRVHKTAEEIAEIEAALAISKEIHESLMREVKPGMQEYYMLGRSLQIAANHGGRLAYGAIASVRGEVLHNVDYHRTIEAGQMVLCDLGAEGPSGYASDITRTFPANAAFSSFQKDIYQLVLNVEETAIGSLAPGVSYRDVHLNAALQFANGLRDMGLMKGNPEDAVAAGAHALFFPHGLGHMMGLDVHDLEGLGEQYVGYDETVQRSTQFGTKWLRLAKQLKPGHVLTVEPGLYFIPVLTDQWRKKGLHKEFIAYDKLKKHRDFGGVRIEDNVLITENAHRVLGPPIAKQVAEVEALRGQAFL